MRNSRASKVSAFDDDVVIQSRAVLVIVRQRDCVDFLELRYFTRHSPHIGVKAKSPFSHNEKRGRKITPLPL